MGNYAWVIDKDYLYRPDDEGSTDAAGITGPYAATDADLARLEAGEGDVFQLFDDDRILYYTGRLVTSGGMSPDEEAACYGPLGDFGAGYAGCSMVEWPEHHHRDCG